MDKIKILYLIDIFYVFGGAERNLYEIVKHINKEKYTPYIFALKAGDEFKEFEKLGVYSKALQVNRIYDLKGIVNLIKLIRFVKSDKIDIIVSYHLGSDILAVIIGKIARVKAIISSRRNMGFNLTKRQILIYKVINNLFTKIITVSNAVSEVIRHREHVEEDKLITVYNGYSMSELKDDNNSLLIFENKYKYVALIATYRRIKGIEYLIKAVPLIRESVKNVKILIIGKSKDDDSEYFEELVSLVDKL